MITKKKVLISLLYLSLALGIFYAWYSWRYSMDTIDTYEVNDPSLEQKILIGTQGSEFKDSVTKKVVDHYKDSPIHIHVTDVTRLDAEGVNNWDAILVLHTWEKWRPQPAAETFLNRVKDKSSILTISTSGSGTEQMKGVDAITSASTLETTTSVAQQATNWLDKKLEATSSYQ